MDRLVAPEQVALLPLTMDRTHWKLDQTDQNLLCLGLLLGEVAIPLEIFPLGKAGNANTQERKQMMRRAWSYLQKGHGCLLADREFIGGDGWAFLGERPGRDFVIRLRENSQVPFADGPTTELGQWVEHLPKGCTWYYHDVLL